MMKDRNDYDVGCPLCWAPVVTDMEEGPTGGRENR
jgi:hypothetical protein